MSELIYAIDYGTSNSLLAAADASGVKAPIPLDPAAPDPTVLRSILYAPSLEQWYFGAQAIDQYMSHLAEGRLLRSMKKYLPESSFTGTRIHDRFYNLTEIIAVFLREMRTRANSHFQQDVTSVVMGRPAAFSLDSAPDELAERRLRTAAQLAGFKHIEFCPEPLAAAYEFRHQMIGPTMVLIADFGGGTSDFTVLRMDKGEFSDKDVLAIGGVPIAGDRFDGAIMRHQIAPHFGANVVYRMPMGSNDLHLPHHLLNRLCTPADISFLARQDIQNLLRDAQRWSMDAGDALKMERLFLLVEEHLGYKLFRSIEHTKIELSDHSEATFIFDHPEIELKEQVYSADFKNSAADLVTRITDALDQTLARAGVTPGDIDIVCCTGGTAKLPALSLELERRFGKEKLRQHRHFHSVIGGLAEKALTLFAPTRSRPKG